MEKKDKIQEAIRLAQDAVSEASPELKQKAFEVVLSHLLGGGGASAASQSSKQQMKQQASEPNVGEGATLNVARIASQLGITEEQAADLYQIKNGVLHLGVRPVGATLLDRQRNLAHALVVGYRLGLDTKEVSITAINEAADEWNVRDSNMSRSLKISNIIQMKGGGKGKKPVFSLAPNSLERASAEITTMFA
jgi:hypothetical protein